MVLMAHRWSIPGSRPISFRTVMPASLAAWSNSCMAGEIYDVVTTCFFCAIAALMTAAWNVYGIRLITSAFFAISASSAASSVTSSEMG